MNGSNSIEENLKRSNDFCPVCIRKLWSTLKFDIKNRLIDLGNGLNKLFEKKTEEVNEEIAWFEKRIMSIMDL